MAWKPKAYEWYFYIDLSLKVKETQYFKCSRYDEIHLKSGNCFRTKKAAQLVCKKFKRILKDSDKGYNKEIK
jgi:hypothetical protein